MSLSISGSSSYSAVNDAADSAEKQPPAKPSVGQEMTQMLSSGDSVAEIAAQLGMSTTLVDSTLGLQTTSTAPAGPTATAVSSAMKLSVLA